VKRYLPALPVCLAAFFVYAYAAWHHPIGSYGTETDFYHFYGPDAFRIASGQFPENPFQGPGFPALVAFVAIFTGDGFVAGKWISVAAATGVLLLVFVLSRRLFGSNGSGNWIGAGAAALVAVSQEFPQFAISATTDTLFLLLALSFLVAFTWNRLGHRTRLVICGGLGGLAYLTRYNGIFLIVAGLVAICLLDYFSLRWRERLISSALLIAVFLITASPWLFANYVNRGSPFYNANHLNIATEFYPELVDGGSNQDATRPLENVFGSLTEVLRYDPVRMVTHYPVNLVQSLVEATYGTLMSPFVACASLAGIVIALWKKRSKEIQFVLIAGLFYFLLMGLIHWETRYYFFLMTLFSGFAVFALASLARNRTLTIVSAFLFAIMWLSSFNMARKDLSGFLKNQPLEILAARDYLRQQGITNARIVARKPHLSFVAGQQWVFFPQVKSVEELGEWLQENPADFVVISTIEIKRRRELSSLRDTNKAPSWLAPAWKHDNPLLILYRTGIRGQGSGIRGQGSGVRGQGIEFKLLACSQ
jgi:Dolichyl-phosphate-mannose-protein mannosyltransferase